MDDLISRQAVLTFIEKSVSKYGDRYSVDMLNMWGLFTQVVKDMPSAQQWIPCSERLPEEEVEVLITYRYKECEGDTSHANMDITTYGQMYFGGNKVGNHKHWRQPFEYFESNYEVVAWMPLPEPYREETES